MDIPAEKQAVCTCEKAISSILSFYTLLTQLPYIPPNKLMIPPPTTGWQNNSEQGINLNATELRNRGKTEVVIDTLRHLPYLDQELYGPHWTLAYDTLHINYARGELYSDYLERDTAILPLPGHIIWLTEGFERAGVYLLLNTETWEIIEYTLLGESIEIGYDAYEALPPDQKWTAYSAMPADEYFDLWKWRHLTLQFVLVPDSQVFKGTAEWFCKDPRFLFEESFVQDEDDDDEEEDEDYVPDESDSDSEEDSISDESDDDDDDDDDDEMEVSQELQSLSFDQPPTQHANTAVTVPETSSRSKRSFLYTHAAILDPTKSNDPRALFLDSWSTKQRKDTKQLIQIYTSHGWPLPNYEWRVSGRYFATTTDNNNNTSSFDLTNFDREACLSAVTQWSRARRDRERAELRAVEEQEKSEIKRKVAATCRRVRKWFLSPGATTATTTTTNQTAEVEAEVDSEVVSYGLAELDELEKLEPVPDDIIVETGIYQTLKEVVDSQTSSKDMAEICDRARRLLKNWEHVILSESR